jgi:S1-C subfamily serine protease
MEGGPADEAGIREGDVITSVDGRSLFTPLEDDLEEDIDLDASVPVQRLLAIARDLEPGEAIEVEYLRDGQPMTATLETEDLAGMWGAWADDFEAQFRPRMERFEQELRPQLEEMRQRIREQARDIDGRQRVIIGRRGDMARYGLGLTDLTPGLADYFGAEQGALVSDVDADSTLGLQPGDVLLAIGDREVTSPSRAARLLSSYDGDESVTFRVLRDGREMEVTGRLGG